MKSAPIRPAWEKICLTCPHASSQGRIDTGFGPQEVRMEFRSEATKHKEVRRVASPSALTRAHGSADAEESPCRTPWRATHSSRTSEERRVGTECVSTV